MENTSVEVSSTNALFSFPNPPLSTPTPTTEDKPGLKNQSMPDISRAPGHCLAKPKAARTFKKQSKKRTTVPLHQASRLLCKHCLQSSRTGQATERVLTLTSSINQTSQLQGSPYRSPSSSTPPLLSQPPTSLVVHHLPRGHSSPAVFPF